MKRKLLFLLSIYILINFASCGLDEHPAYDLKFIHIMKDETSSTRVSAKANTIATYNVYLSAPSPNETVNVVYDIIVGNGLKEGVDFKLLSNDFTLTFLQGIFEMPIRIQWIANPVDPTKDNTVTIKLISNDKGYDIGLPGPDKKQSEFMIRKD